jgi:hypothetical protein
MLSNEIGDAELEILHILEEFPKSAAQPPTREGARDDGKPRSASDTGNSEVSELLTRIIGNGVDLTRIP